MPIDEPGAAFGIVGHEPDYVLPPDIADRIRLVEEAVADARPAVARPAVGVQYSVQTSPADFRPLPSDPPTRPYIEPPHYDPTEILQLVARRRRARKILRRIDVAIEHEVERARECGASWDEIGRHLGITRQGARQRYAEHSVHITGEPTASSTDSAASPPNGPHGEHALRNPTRGAAPWLPSTRP
ncbi:hypothetical protein [uncultured Cellulomonas sp.]|uniref:hypothetical protein n=1 Tax=uncultured Cellulomonas sp. TaxID=189682 RepID=UPI0028E6A55D|nr:hypothetical protein [uncultured Cellulomonas sp.]